MAILCRNSRKVVDLLTKIKQKSLMDNSLTRFYNTEIVLPNIAKGTAEGPLWLRDRKSLLFVDALDGDIHVWDSVKNEISSVHYDDFVTFAIPHERGGYVAGVGHKVIHFDWDNHHNFKTLAEVDVGKPTRMVDGKCDRFGRLFLGTMGLESKPAVPILEQGSLYSLNTNNKLAQLDDKLHISNSMTWSPDYGTFYLVESIPGLIYAYDYDLETGGVSNRRIAIYLPHTEHGVIDRITMDTDGNIWAAYYGGGKVNQIDPRKGEIIRTIKLDCRSLTCLNFGGENYDELFVTSSSFQEDLQENPQAGSIFKITGLGARGLPPNYYNGK